MTFFRFRLILLLIIGSVASSWGQLGDIRNDDYVYVDNIKSVQFFIDGLEISQPIVQLGGNTRLILSFDDLDTDAKDYVYNFVHCDRDWQPSDLAEMEYLDGFGNSWIRDFRYSIKTVVDYTNYQLVLPNEEVNWRVSGNYLLIVYEDADEKIPVITRRFVVTEQLVRIIPDNVRPNKVSKMRTHQEVDFVVNHEELKIRSPQQEVRAVVLQNGRWDSAIKAIPPIFTRVNEMIFDYQDRIVFPAGKEFRFLDIRSFRLGTQSIAKLDQYENGFDVSLFLDKKRDLTPYIFIEDLNGNFIIETMDQNDNILAANYADVLFTLKTPTELYDQDVYIFGKFTDWQLLDEFKMEYNNIYNGYVGKAMLKQGYYDYAYAVAPRGKKAIVPDLAEMEGNWFETSNNYTILVYYRPFGGRYDRLIGATTFSSGL